MKRMLIAAAAAGGLLTMSYALNPAQAAPLSPAAAAAQPNVVIPVAQGMHGGGMGMHGGGGMGSHGMGVGRPGGAGHFAYRGGGAPRLYRGRAGGHGHGHNHRHFYAAPFVGYGAYYGDSYYSGSGCSWLHRRAEATGSGYWWSRYEACVDGNS